MKENLIGSRRVAEYLNISQRSVQNLADRGDLPGYRVCGRLRFKPSDIEAYLEGLQVSPSPVAVMPTFMTKPAKKSVYSLPKPQMGTA